MKTLKAPKILASAGLVVLGSLLASLAGFAQGPDSDQAICSTVNLSGFENSTVTTGFESTDEFDSVHQCSTDDSSGCSACNGYGSPPKNVGFFLCLPDTQTFTVDAGCEELLTAGDSDSCKPNPFGDLSICPPNTEEIAPDCNWRTKDNKDDVRWTWDVTQVDAELVVSCKNENFEGPEQ